MIDDEVDAMVTTRKQRAMRDDQATNVPAENAPPSTSATATADKSGGTSYSVANQLFRPVV